MEKSVARYQIYSANDLGDVLKASPTSWLTSFVSERSYEIREYCKYYNLIVNQSWSTFTMSFKSSKSPRCSFFPSIKDIFHFFKFVLLFHSWHLSSSISSLISLALPSSMQRINSGCRRRVPISSLVEWHFIRRHIKSNARALWFLSIPINFFW